MRILICDDDPLAIEQIHKNLKSFFTYKHIKCPEVISYSCGEDLLNDTGNHRNGLRLALRQHPLAGQPQHW